MSTARCKSCGKAIRFARLSETKVIPLDPMPQASGTFRQVERNRWEILSAARKAQLPRGVRLYAAHKCKK